MKTAILTITSFFNNLSVMKSESSLVTLRIGACVHIAGVDRDDQLIVLHVLVTVLWRYCIVLEVIRPKD